MNKIKYYLLLLIICISFSCSEKKHFGNSELKEKITEVSKEDFANKQKFDDDTIKLEGRIFLDLENKFIEVANRKIWINSFEPATNLDEKLFDKLNNKKVVLIGLYQIENTGHLNQYDEQIKNIYYLRIE